MLKSPPDAPTTSSSLEQEWDRADNAIAGNDGTPRFTWRKIVTKSILLLTGLSALTLWYYAP